MSDKLYFSSDYMEGAHPAIIEKLAQTNLCHTVGYGFDEYCESAREKIRTACGAPDADVYFIPGGTQTNATVISGLLRIYQGVIAANTGHIAGHEAGAIEYSGHKVITLPHKLGKITAQQIEEYISIFYADENCDHMVQPGMVYISNPTEYGTLYSKAELRALSEVCRKYKIPLYLDGARLAYALACEENDITLSDLASLCDVFYIGGTKCGALLGEAVVIPKHDYIGHFFTVIKENGALLAKGRVLGIQFDTLFENDLYLNIGKDAVRLAQKIKKALVENGYTLFFDTPANQIFAVMDNDCLEKLSEKVVYGFWERADEDRTVIRFATSWATNEEDVDKLIEILKGDK